LSADAAYPFVVELMYVLVRTDQSNAPVGSSVKLSSEVLIA